MRFLAGLLLLFASCAWSAGNEVSPLKPNFQATITVSCATSTTAGTLATITGLLGDLQLEVQNNGSAVVFVEIGSSTVTAAVATGYPILAGQSKVITVGPRVTTIACISSTGTQTVYATIGQGN